MVLGCQGGAVWPCSLAPSLGNRVNFKARHPHLEGAAYGSVHPLGRSLSFIYALLHPVEGCS